MIKKLALIISILLVCTGVILLIIGIASKGFKSSNADATHEYSFTDNISDINIDTSTANLQILKASDDKCTVECQEKDKLYHEVTVVDGKLTIKEKDTRSWVDRMFSFNFIKMLVKIYLPLDSYNELKIKSKTGKVEVSNEFSFNNVKIKLSTGSITFKSNVNEALDIETSTGNISLSDINVASLKAKASTGKITLMNVGANGDIFATTSTGDICIDGGSCDNLTIEASTGDISLSNFIASGKLTSTSSNGDVDLDKFDAESMNIHTSTGHVKGNILTGKTFKTHTSTGKVEVPSTTGGECNIETSTGHIKITITN